MKRFLFIVAAISALSVSSSLLKPSLALAANNQEFAGCPGSPFPGPKIPNVKCPSQATLSASAKADLEAAGESASTLNQNATKTNCSNGSGGRIFTATPGLNLDCSGNKNPIYALLQFIINWAIRLLGVLAVLAIVVSGIQYIMSQGSPEGLKAAKSRLSHAVIGLIILSLMFVILRLIGVAS